MRKNICKRDIYSSYQAFYKKLCEDPSYSPEKEYSSQDLQTILECSKSTLSDVMKHLIHENADYINRRITGRSYYYKFIPLDKETIEVSKEEFLMLTLWIYSEAYQKQIQIGAMGSNFAEQLSKLFFNEINILQEYKKIIEILKAFTQKKICIIETDYGEAKAIITKFGIWEDALRAYIHFFKENSPNTQYGQQYEYLYTSIKSPKCTDIPHLQDIEELLKENENK